MFQQLELSFATNRKGYVKCTSLFLPMKMLASVPRVTVWCCLSLEAVIVWFIL
jgi:hypothetical protein